MAQQNVERITLKRSRPNPIFEDWLEELYTEAREKKSKLEPLLKEALESMSKYPLPLNSGAECAILKGFDKKLCIFLDKRLEVYYSNLNDAQPGKQVTVSSHATTGSSKDIQKPSTSTNSANGNSINVTEAKGSSSSLSTDNTPTESTSGQSNDWKSAEESRICKPEFRSGTYAILIALLEQGNKPSHPGHYDEEIMHYAKRHCEKPFRTPKGDLNDVAWSSMTSLVQQGLIVSSESKDEKVGTNKKFVYSFSDDGFCLAMNLLEEYNDRSTVNDILFNNVHPTPKWNPITMENNSSSSSSTMSSQMVDPVTPVFFEPSSSNSVLIDMPADSFDIILLIDKNETGGISKKNDPTVALFKQYTDLKHEYRSLKVGDFTWIARHKNNKDDELVLPYIVERKRMDDLGASIKDGRFHEQKFRLRRCGLNNVIYLVENHGSNKHVGLPFQSLMQALANTRVQDGFKVHVTDSLNRSARFLAMMTRRLTFEFKDKHLKGRNQESQGELLMTFDYFNKAAIKNKPMTVTEVFIKLLIQLKGLSVEKALAITEVYSTPKALFTQYEKCNQKEGETLLANLKCNNQKRSVGPALSKSIYKFFVWQE